MSMRHQAGIVLPGYNPLKVANAPTIGTATAASSVSVSVTFTAPTDVGGSAISSYIATAKKTSDGTTVNTSGAASPIVITGLTASTTYTVTVVAINSYGPSAPSAASNSVTTAEAPPTVIGQAFGGGYYAGQIGVSSVATHYIVVGPVASAQNLTVQWKTSNTSTAGTNSDIDGPANSTAMNNASHPAAQFCEGLTVGGFTDWYMPAKNELEVCYYNLKPSTESNQTSSGINPNAVPARASNYTSGTPSQTSAATFRTGQSEAFFAEGADWWCSTQGSAYFAWNQKFGSGGQYNGNNYKTGSNKVRAIRRVAV
jgi:hypothetical protein